MVTITTGVENVWYYLTNYPTPEMAPFGGWGIKYYNGYWYIIEYNFGTDGHVLKYDADFTFIAEYDPTIEAAGCTEPTGITTDGTYMYLVDNTDAYVYKFNMDFTSLVATIDIGALGLNDDPMGIEWDGSDFFITDWTDAKVYKYPSDFSAETTSYNIQPSSCDFPFGICWDGTYWYVVDNGDRKVYQFNSDFSSNVTKHIVDTISGGKNAACRGVGFDGTYYYTVDASDKVVYKYKTQMDITSDIIDCKITTELRKVPKATMRVNGQSFGSDDIMQVEDNYTSFKNGRGNYKDSCDFRSETIGSVPAQTDGGTWTDSDGADCESIIIDKYNGHSMILQLRDEGAGAAIMDLDITNTATGKVEFWMATTDPTYELTITLLDQQPAIHAGLQIDNENINYYHDGGWVDSGEDAEVGVWYRCVIHFCCALHKSIYSVYNSAGTEIFSVSNKDSPAPSSTVNDIKFTTQTTDADYLCFIDAIGFDWDTAYTLGDNANLEVTLADQTIFEGQIIKQDKRTIQTLQLKSITAEMEQSIDDDTDLPAGYIPNMLSVLAGKLDHATATEQDEIFRGTLNFLNDTVGADVTPMGWMDLSSGTTTVGLAADINGHKQVMDIFDNQNGGQAHAQYRWEGQESGTIEWWASQDDVTDETSSSIRDYTTNKTVTGWEFDGDNINYLVKGTAWTLLYNSPTDNTWYRFRVDFECGAGGYSDASGNTLGANEFSIYVYSAAGVELGKAENQDMYNNPDVVLAEGIQFYSDTVMSGYHCYIDAIGLSWDYRYPEYHTYAAGDNKQILVDEHEASTIRAAVHTADVVINKSNKASKVYNDLSDEELSTWYILPSKKVSMNLGDEDSGFDLASGDKVWAVKGIDNITRINKVVVKGGDDGVDWALGEADDLDTQATYGIKLIMVYAPEIKNDTDADNLAAEILVKYQNAPNKTSFFLHDTTYGMLQVGETITIPADTFYYSKSLTFIAEGEWIITKIVYEPDTGISQITVVDNLVFEPDEDDIKFIEDMVRQI